MNQLIARYTQPSPNGVQATRITVMVLCWSGKVKCMDGKTAYGMRFMNVLEPGFGEQWN